MYSTCIEALNTLNPRPSPVTSRTSLQGQDRLPHHHHHHHHHHHRCGIFFLTFTGRISQYILRLIRDKALIKKKKKGVKLN
ncbi:hypothetical protein E2C01_066458 [Portunus trituberculatus]|uniref:Uncharacterized protein n=1 Tax=Portunus trituberculatus TaxID=210409 RepID=A0A5B7HUQ7_PORTR|nr:hypothetical protein [Portunus trituberculatus]